MPPYIEMSGGTVVEWAEQGHAPFHDDVLLSLAIALWVAAAARLATI
jgi:hypothetical protein